MIELKDACRKIWYDIGTIRDCGDFWVFGFAREAEASASAVYKRNGETFRWFPPDLTPEQRRAYKSGKNVPIPE